MLNLLNKAQTTTPTPNGRIGEALIADALALLQKGFLSPEDQRAVAVGAAAVDARGGPRDRHEMRLCEIADRISIVTPNTPSIATPFDAKIDEARAAADAEEAKRLAAAAERERVHAEGEHQSRTLRANVAAGRDVALSQLDAPQAAYREAVEAYLQADGAVLRAKARLTALQLAADRWRAQQELERATRR